MSHVAVIEPVLQLYEEGILVAQIALRSQEKQCVQAYFAGGDSYSTKSLILISTKLRESASPIRKKTTPNVGAFTCVARLHQQDSASIDRTRTKAAIPVHQSAHPSCLRNVLASTLRRASGGDRARKAYEGARHYAPRLRRRLV